MNGNFKYYNPTKLYFGEQSLNYLKEELKNFGTTVLLNYGSGSVKRNGIYDEVVDMDRFVDNDGFLLSQNNPNPFSATTDIYLAVIETAEVTLAIADVYGHLEATYKGSFEPGVHQLLSQRTRHPRGL